MEKGKLFFAILFALFLLSAKSGYAQSDTSIKKPINLYVITTNDGGQLPNRNMELKESKINIILW